MVLDSRIKRMRPDYFRFTLTRGDVLEEGLSGKLLEVVSSVGSIIEYALVLDGYISYPYIPYSKYYKIGTDDYGELKKLVCSYLFLNPGIGIGGLHKMADFISQYHIFHYSLDVPSFSFDEVLEVCNDMHNEYPDGSSPITERPKLILFQPSSKLTSSDKRRYTNFARSSDIRRLWEEIIYLSADHAIENTKPFMVVSSSLVIKSSHSLLTNNTINKSISSINLYNKYVNDKTVDLLTEDSKHRYIHERSYDKWETYLGLNDDLSMRSISDKLKISLSTVIEFKRIKDRYNL